MTRKQSKPCHVKEGRKKCPRCNTIQSVLGFAQCKRSKSGLQTWCKQCMNTLSKQQREENYEHRRAIEIRSAEKHPASRAYNSCATRKAKTGKRLRKDIPICKRADFIQWYDNADKTCCYCGMVECDAIKIHSKKLSVERFIPESGYIIGNIGLACQRCNLIKSSFLTKEQMEVVGDLFFRQSLTPEEINNKVNAHDELMGLLKKLYPTEISDVAREDVKQLLEKLK